MNNQSKVKEHDMKNSFMDEGENTEKIKDIGVPIQSLHHFANYCHDAEETRHFYEDILGLKLIHILRGENLPGSGIHQPYLHLFFEMEDKSSLAFFDLLDAPNHPGMTAEKPWTNHIALRVSNMDQLLQAKARLQDAGIAIQGPIDHEFVESIYFLDPNGVNLELTVNTANDQYMQHECDTAHAKLKEWNEEKKAHMDAIGVSV